MSEPIFKDLWSMTRRNADRGDYAPVGAKTLVRRVKNLANKGLTIAVLGLGPSAAIVVEPGHMSRLDVIRQARKARLAEIWFDLPENQ